MLAEMSSTQYTELVLFFRLEHEEREEKKAVVQDAKLRSHFERLMADQKRRGTP